MPKESKHEKLKKLREWHKKVCERDGYVCQLCGKDFSYSCYFNEKDRNQFVFGHHKLTQGSRPDLKYDVGNGVCVCNQPSTANGNVGCHNKIHIEGITFS